MHAWYYYDVGATGQYLVDMQFVRKAGHWQQQYVGARAHLASNLLAVTIFEPASRCS